MLMLLLEVTARNNKVVAADGAHSESSRLHAGPPPRTMADEARRWEEAEGGGGLEAWAGKTRRERAG